jgi:hypothetical protein
MCLSEVEKTAKSTQKRISGIGSESLNIVSQLLAVIGVRVNILIYRVKVKLEVMVQLLGVRQEVGVKVFTRCGRKEMCLL